MADRLAHQGAGPAAGAAARPDVLGGRQLPAIHRAQPAPDDRADRHRPALHPEPVRLQPRLHLPGTRLRGRGVVPAGTGDGDHLLRGPVRREPEVPPMIPMTGQRRRSKLLTAAMLLFLLYALFPLLWLIVSATKTENDLFSTFGLGFGHRFALFSNIRQTLTYAHGEYLRWLANTVVYAATSAVGAACLATPTYFLFSKAGLVDTPWAVILPSLVSPFGFFLMWVYARDAVNDSILDAARIDGAGELAIFFRVSLRSLVPGFATVVLFTLVATWNNYFLPLIMLSNPKYFPITVGLAAWESQTAGGGGSNSALISTVVTGSLLSVIPLIIAFIFLQRYWQSGLSAGAVKE